MTKDSIKVSHPEFGHVVFNGMTIRQMDVLKRVKPSLEWLQKKQQEIKKTKR